MATTDLVLDIEGMTCASCVQKVERALGDVDGVEAAAVNLATRTATVRGAVDGFEPLIGAVARVGYGARPHDEDRDPTQEERAYRRRLLVAAPLTAVILVLTFVVRRLGTVGLAGVGAGDAGAVLRGLAVPAQRVAHGHGTGRPRWTR